MPVGKCRFRSFLSIIMKNTRSVKSCFPCLSNSTIEKFGEVLELITSFFGTSEHWHYWSRENNVLLVVEKRQLQRKKVGGTLKNGISSCEYLQSRGFNLWTSSQIWGDWQEGWQSLYQWYAVWENNNYYQELVFVFQCQCCRKNTQSCNWSI